MMLLTECNTLYQELLDQFSIDQLIRGRAHELWEQEGRPYGHGEAHWLRAEAEVRGALRRI
jgi:hypothetical protein